MFLRAVCPLFAAVLCLAAADTHADIISLTDTRLWTSNLVDLESGGKIKDSTAITDRYVDQGLMFSGDIRINGCGVNSYTKFGMSGSYLNTFGPNCYTNRIDDRFSMTFATPVSRLSMNVYAGDFGRDDWFTLFSHGSEVASFQLWELQNASGGMHDPVQIYGLLNIDGLVFDQLRFAEASASDASYLVFDNVGFTPVPEAGTAALMAAALGGWLMLHALIQRSRAARRARARGMAARTWSESRW